jgi:solute carrier family 25 citrate transporter 1
VSGKKSKNPAKAIVAGAISGAVEACISYPTEFVKTQLQLFEDKAKLGPVQCAKQTVQKDGVWAAWMLLPSRPICFRTVDHYSVRRRHVDRAGFLGLYRGLSSLLYFSVPKVATRFLTYETLRGKLQRPDGSLSTLNTLLCGLGAGTAEAIVAVTPMDTIKTRLIHDQLSRAPADRRYKGFFHGVTTIVREQGFGGIYKGLTATILKQGASALQAPHSLWASRCTPRSLC